MKHVLPLCAALFALLPGAALAKRSLFHCGEGDRIVFEVTESSAEPERFDAVMSWNDSRRARRGWEEATRFVEGTGTKTFMFGFFYFEKQVGRTTHLAKLTMNFSSDVYSLTLSRKAGDKVLDEQEFGCRRLEFDVAPPVQRRRRPAS